uniref:G-protein coupled receptors family 1 profile domain-containing protein n=1 Tax=Lepisosteus oculatus TaxID=7918 RepID=W5MNE1_LEPOC
ISNSTDDKHNTEETMKTYVHLLAFIFTFVFSYCIMRTIRKEAALRNQVRYILLCHHLICVVAFFGVGILFHGLRMFRVAVPRIVCWIIFDIQVTLGRGIILTLTLMALNTCLSVCAPLRYLSIIHSLKGKVIIITWILATLNPVWSTIQASCTVQLTYLTERDPTCPTALHGTDSRIAAIVFLSLLSLLIIFSYCLIYREGKRAGHFSRSNIRGRKTILIHSLQMSLHIIPTFIILATVRKPFEVKLLSFLVFSVAQALSPIVFGLRSKELKSKLPEIKFDYSTLYNDTHILTITASII